MNQKEELLCSGRSNKEDKKFDAIIGVLEDTVVEDHFLDMQEKFLEKHYMEFEDVEENKFIYSDIFREYMNMVETHIEGRLVERIPGFKMAEFLKTLASKQSQIDEGIFEMLLTFTDFLAFKQMVLDYRKAKEGVTPDLSCGIIVSSCLAEPAEQSSQNKPLSELEEVDRTSFEHMSPS